MKNKIYQNLPKNFKVSLKRESTTYSGKVIDYEKIIFLSFIGILLTIFFLFSFHKIKEGILIFLFFGSWIWVPINNKITIVITKTEVIILRGISFFSKKIFFLKNDFIDAQIKYASFKNVIGSFLYGSNPTKTRIKYVLIKTRTKEYKFYNNLKNSEKTKLINLIKYHCTNN